MASVAQSLSRECRIVLVSGFESFNVELYKKVSQCILFLSIFCASRQRPKIPQQTCCLAIGAYLSKPPETGRRGQSSSESPG